MELEEAKRRLKRVITTSTIMKLENSMESYADLEYIKNANSLEIILQELDRLQKENEELKKGNEVADRVNELQEKHNSINKDKLIEVIDFAINATDSTDDYSIGLCNGMIYVKALLTDGNPDYKKCQNNKEEKTYEFGLVVGTKREREYWENKIREKIKKIYEDKNSEYYDMFLEQRDIEKTISILKDLLKEE